MAARPHYHEAKATEGMTMSDSNDNRPIIEEVLGATVLRVGTGEEL